MIREDMNEQRLVEAQFRDGRKNRIQRGKKKTDLNGAGSGMINGDGDGKNRIFFTGTGMGTGMVIPAPITRYPIPDTYIYIIL